MPERIDREKYTKALVIVTGFREEVLIEEVQELISSGRALKVAGGVTADAPPAKPSDIEEGWWNRDRGEGEDLWDFFYRRYCRLRIANHLVDWWQFDQWAEMVEDLMRDSEMTMFAAEWKAWEKIRDAVIVSDPSWQDMHGPALGEEDDEARMDKAVDDWEWQLARISLLVPDEKLGPIIDRAEEIAADYKRIPGWEWMVDAIQERLDQIWDERTRGITAALDSES